MDSTALTLEMRATFCSKRADFEEGYLLARTTEEKAEIIQAYHDGCREDGMKFEILDNFGAMINVLCGVL
jgi:hypothetical protein